jgi:hypothetical protein
MVEGSPMNIEFRVAIVRTFRTQIAASKRLRIREDKLSHFVQGHQEPSAREREILKKALGADYFGRPTDETPAA